MNKLLTSTVAIVLAQVQIAAAVPKVGDRLPDVTAYSEDGKPFQLRKKLEGKPAVLVFGCLT